MIIRRPKASIKVYNWHGALFIYIVDKRTANHMNHTILVRRKEMSAVSPNLIITALLNHAAHKGIADPVQRCHFMRESADLLTVVIPMLQEHKSIVPS
jgi:hypothetical protein